MLVLAAAVLALALPLQGKTVAIDPGHNGRNWAHTTEIGRLVDAGTLRKACDTTGTATAGGYSEAAYTFDVARRLARLLRAAGARVVLTRTTQLGVGAVHHDPRRDREPGARRRGDLDPRRRWAGRWARIPRHLPAAGRGPDRRHRGRVAAARARGPGRVRCPHGRAVRGLRRHRGLDVRSDLGGLNLSDVPKVFVETGNMRNPVDARRLESVAYRQREAVALARGLEKFLR